MADLELTDFAEGVRPLLPVDFGSVGTVTIPQIEDYRFRELMEAFPEATAI